MKPHAWPRTVKAVLAAPSIVALMKVDLVLAIDVNLAVNALMLGVLRVNPHTLRGLALCTGIAATSLLVIRTLCRRNLPGRPHSARDYAHYAAKRIALWANPEHPYLKRPAPTPQTADRPRGA